MNVNSHQFHLLQNFHCLRSWNNMQWWRSYRYLQFQWSHRYKTNPRSICRYQLHHLCPGTKSPRLDKARTECSKNLQENLTNFLLWNDEDFWFLAFLSQKQIMCPKKPNPILPFRVLLLVSLSKKWCQTSCKNRPFTL